MKIKNRKLNNGYEIPAVGYGSSSVLDWETIYTAIEVGYRLIDTASVYNNSHCVKKAINEAIKNKLVTREELFITSKCWVDIKTTDDALKEFDREIKALGLDYIDLYLIHWPHPDHHKIWMALEKLYKEGRVKAIGVSNYYKHHFLDLFEKGISVTPMVNQLELHPGLENKEVQVFCKEHNILIQAWRSILKGHQETLQEPRLQSIGQKYQKTAAQILLNWAYSQGILLIPKSSKKARMIENLQSFDFTLTNEEIKKISSIEVDRIGFDNDKFWNQNNKE